MVLCPPFRWSAKGGFNLTNSNNEETKNTQRRETIFKIPEPTVDISPSNGLLTNSNGPQFKKSLTISAEPGVSSKKSSYMSVQSEKSSSSNNQMKDSDSETLDERESSAGTKTISEIIANNPEKRERRKRGVIAPHAPHDTVRSYADLQYEKFAKDEGTVELIKKAIMANDFLRNLMDEERLSAVVEAMNSQEYPAGSLMIREGESGSHLFVSAHGQFEVLKGGQVVKNFGPGEAFGELAILYKAKRFASIRCITEAKVWTLERRVFQKIMVRSGRQEQEDNIRFLSSVSLLQGIHEIELAQISEFLKREFFSAGTPVVRQGDRADKFYIIRGGAVVVTKREDDGVERRVATLRRGEYFGEQALLHEDRRLATVTALPPGVECLTLERAPFTEFLGNLEELRNIRHAVPRLSQQRKASEVKSEFDFVELKDLEFVGTMGVGGFGRVELMQYKRNPSLTFALKCLKKIDMVEQQQQEHAFNEKNIMMACHSRFICRLYRTFKDNKYIYFLMEPVLGGDVWTILQKKRYFPENVARFMAACVVEAFQYLHSKDIIYRDLKPENLMLDKHGYIKLVDFGFAKLLPPNGKTWTFAGTPEYVAPEIVVNKGHDRAADYWTLGVLTHELLVGKPPFRAPGGDHMKTYTLILRGIDAVTFHPRVSKSAQLLIRKLCRPAPAERLGYLKNGIADIKNHKWFLGFDWEGLREGKLKAPLVQTVMNDLDLSNFEKYPKDKQPPDETSGWDMEF
ncbi:cGMP-dependent protein kinase 1-like [Epargyreus clarus]|uniref:cGMP-dependent protein kinase 1-like n=1 Tax=Epargyreus clarus TaxID=520877 RepID=UPI003C2E165F